MNDNEIIKALEWLKEMMGVCSSDDEYIYGEIILDLINRQQAEKERLSKKNEELAETLLLNREEAVDIELMISPTRKLKSSSTPAHAGALLSEDM